MIIHFARPNLSAQLAVLALKEFSRAYSRVYRDTEAPDSLVELKEFYRSFIERHGDEYGMLATPEAVREYAEKRKA